MTDKAIDFIDVMEQLVRLREGESGFRKRLGPTERCYTPRDLVNLFEWGANERDSAHIAECENCAKWVRNYAQRPRYSRVAAAAAAGAMSRVSRLFGWLRPPQLDPAMALLLAGDRVITVSSEPGSGAWDLSLPVVVGPTDNIFSRIDVSSLQLDGSIVAREAALEPPKAEGAEWWDKYPIIRFRDVRPAPKVHFDFHENFGFTDQVCVTGRLTDAADQVFRGQAIVTLKKG